ncbi:hypothetical protein [Actinoplanes auranticolor]|uniref:Uncharacterized protein n=1 Tax=Actinoplanes auranticolor TaxID=47988 RepID=A0A919SWF6_9ACTN|nr:hypothetical protein [Actinoplanes auranticolor]GIM80100.1 hypothetical protein Aau02nite_88990 [Actinoplanes auranticolor]
MQATEDSIEIRLGVLLAESGPEVSDNGLDGDEELLEEGHVPAAGYRGRHTIKSDNRVVQLGNDVLRAAAEAVGGEVALVLDGVLAGIERRTPAAQRAFAIEDLELKFGVKATLGAGKAVEALLTATGEATVEVTLKLRQQL